MEQPPPQQPQQPQQQDKCAQCGSLKHVRNDCPAYKITQRFARDVSHGYYYTHYDVPVYDTHCHIDYVFDRFKHKGLSWEEFKCNESFPHNFKGRISIVSILHPLSSVAFRKTFKSHVNYYLKESEVVKIHNLRLILVLKNHKINAGENTII